MTDFTEKEEKLEKQIQNTENEMKGACEKGEEGFEQKKTGRTV